MGDQLGHGAGAKKVVEGIMVRTSGHRVEKVGTEKIREGIVMVAISRVQVRSSPGLEAGKDVEGKMKAEDHGTFRADLDWKQRGMREELTASL